MVPSVALDFVVVSFLPIVSDGDDDVGVEFGSSNNFGTELVKDFKCWLLETEADVTGKDRGDVD